MGTKVWIVEKRYDYEGNDVEAVFSTEEKALRYIAKLARDGMTSGAKLSHYEMTVDKLEVSP